ncbi:MAG TPA: sulfatase [Candidatus Krumholzibacteria bacterium]|nr:sulfatase [Candidatus Krumholzibacteria bacterium]
MKYRFLRSLVIGCVTALTVACIDGVVGLAAASTRFSSPSFAALVVAMTAVVALLVFLVCRWAVVEPIFGRTRDEHPLSIATAMGVAVLFVCYDVRSPHTGVTGLVDWTLYLALAAAMGLGWYALVSHTRQTRAVTIRRLFGRTLAFIMPLGMVVAWVAFVAVNDTTSVPSYFAYLLFAGAVFVIARLVRSTTLRGWGLAAVITYAVVVFVGLGGGVEIERSREFAMSAAAANSTGKIQQVIFLTVDTLRRDCVSAYGSKTVSTPNIDAIASQSYLFSNVTASSSWTEPSFSSMLTGLPTDAHRVTTAAMVLPDTITTVAERFRDAGYATAAFVANGMLAPHRGFAQGFKLYDIRAIHLKPVSLGESLAAKFERKPVEDATSTRDVTNLAIKWSHAHRNQSFFLWLHYYDPHLPYTPPRQFVQHMPIDDKMGYSLNITSLARPTMDLFGTPAERAWARSLYEADVRYVDSEIGRFVASLKKSNIYDNSLIVFAVDHGEEFWDHDGFEHGHTLYQELIGVPLMFKLPGGTSEHKVDDPVSGYDVTPTILDLCGLPPVDTPTGISAAGLMTGKVAHLPARPLFSGGTLFRSHWESVVFDGWKYIRSETTGRDLLFNLADDPGERNSLVVKYPDIVARGQAYLDEHERAMEAYREERGISNPTVRMDEEELQRLRTLGYL